MTITQIRKLILALPAEQRAELAEWLEDSWEEFPETPEFVEELRRRDTEMDRDEFVGRSHEEVMTEANRILNLS